LLEAWRDVHTLFTRTLLALLLFMGLPACKPKDDIASGMDARSIAVHFELKTDPVWQAPKRGQLAEVSLALEMANLGPHPIRFPLMDCFHVAIENPDGVMRAMAGGFDGLRPGQPISEPVAPGGKFVLRLRGQISRGADDQLRLRIEDALGGTWWIDPVDTGVNLLHMTFESQSAGELKDKDIWAGRAVIAPVRIQIITH